MDEEQGLASPIAGGIRGIRRSVSSGVFTGRSVLPQTSAPAPMVVAPQPAPPDPQVTSLLNQNALSLSNVSGQLQNITAQVGQLSNSLTIIQENLSISDQLDRQREAAKQRREAILAQQGLREGKESDLEQKVQFALLTPVRRVAAFAQGILSRLTNFLLILAGGWLVDQTLSFLRLKSEGNVEGLKRLRNKIISDLLITGGIFTAIIVIVQKTIMMMKALAGMAFRFVVGNFIKRPFRLLTNFIKNNVKQFATLIRKAIGQAFTRGPATVLKVAASPLKAVGNLVFGGLGIKALLDKFKGGTGAAATTQGAKGFIGKVGKRNILINTIFGAFNFIGRRKDTDGDGKPDQTIFQALAGSAAQIIGGAAGFAGGMKLGAIAGSFIGGPVGTLVGGILGAILGIIGSMMVGGVAEKTTDKITGVEPPGTSDGQEVEGTGGEVEIESVGSMQGTSENVIPINTKKDVDMVSKLELEEGSPTIVNLPLQNQNNGSGTQNGAAVSSKTEGQPIPNIPSSDFANNTVVMAESAYNLGGVG